MEARRTGQGVDTEDMEDRDDMEETGDKLAKDKEVDSSENKAAPGNSNDFDDSVTIVEIN